ncbi:MAG: DUF1572 domain-containing protein, partial [Chitinophagaceae bacterium]
HMHGNMMSRWTDFLTTDGEKEWRRRDEEFEVVLNSKQELINRWEAGWKCMFSAIDALNETDLDKTVYIRTEAHTVAEAINRQLAHYPYHVGQIVFIGKMLAERWDSLSIARGNSQQYNTDKFSEPKQRAHFTDEYLKIKNKQ